MNEKDKSIYIMNPEVGWWPTKEQRLLLRASILRGKEAIEALQEWKANINIANLDQGSQRLLPLLYHNLHSQGIEDTLMNRFKGVHRLTWYKNQLLFHHVAILLHSFHNDGIQTMVLKGAALSLFYYRDYGLRPMTDFDILVQSKQASAAINLIIKSGWTQKSQRLLEHFPEIYFSVNKAFNFESTNRCELDLHWHLLSECCYPGADDDFWGNAVPAKIHDISTQILDPTDQLLHVCVHGAKWNHIPTFRWAADAMMILNATQYEIDWNRLIMQAQKRCLVLPLKDTLNYLRDVLNAPIPSTILHAIKNMTISKNEHFKYKFYNHPSKHAGPLGSFWVRYLQYLRITHGMGLINRIVGFPKFLQYCWQVDYLWQVPVYAIFKTMKKIYNMLVLYRTYLSKMLRQKYYS